MKLQPWLCLLAGAVPVISSALKPLVAHEVKYAGVAEKRHVDVDRLNYIEGRNLNLGTINFAKTFPAKDVLFRVSLGKAQEKGGLDGALYTSVTCISCYTTGKAVITTEGVKGSLPSTIGSEISNFFKHPLDVGDITTDIIVDAFDLNVAVNLENLGGHFEFDITFGAMGTYTVNLFKSESPAGVALNDDDKIGFILSLDLMFTVSAAIDFSTGFDIVFPKGANFVFNPLNGKLVSHESTGAQVKAIPVKLISGSACVTAILRLKFQAGVGLKVMGKGFDFEAGVYFDPIQYSACVTYKPAAACEIAFTENFYEEIGAYARAVVDLDFAKLSAGPTAVTTYLTAPLPSACISSKAHSATTKALPKTTAHSPPEKDVSKNTVVSKTVPHATSKHSAPHEASSSKKTVPHATSAHKTSKHVPSGSHPASHNSGKSSGSAHPSGSHPASHSSGKATGSHPASHSSGKPTGSDRPTGTSKHGAGSSHHVSSKPHKPTSLPHSRYSNSTSKAAGGGRSTTSTITKTSVYTITSCKPEVTDCPGRIGQVTSEVIITTTVCPVSGAEPTAAGPGPGPSSQKGGASVTKAPAGSDLTTKTISTTSLYTITSCLAQVIHCPASHVSEIVQTKTIIQYTTVCPVSQTEFPSALPTVSAVATVPEVKTVVVVNPIPLTTLATPIVQTLNTYVPPFSFAGNATATAPYPTRNVTKSIVRPTAPSSRLHVKPTTVKPSAVKSSGAAPSLPEAGGPLPSTEIRHAKAQAETSPAQAPSASPTFQQASGASSGSVAGYLQLAAAGVVGVIAVFM